MRRPPTLLIALGASARLALAQEASGDSSSDFTPIAEVRSRALRAGRVEPVRIRGVVTFFHKSFPLGFVQDETGGIAFLRPKTSKPNPLPVVGHTVELEGRPVHRHDMLVMASGGDGGAQPPLVRPSPSASGALPPARIADLGDTLSARFDGEVVRTAAIVRRVVRARNGGGIVTLSSRFGLARARLAWSPTPEEAAACLNQVVRVQGVLLSQGSPEFFSKEAEALLLVASPRGWEVQRPLLDHVFQAEALDARQAALASPRDFVHGRLHVQGTVTAVKPRQWLMLRTAAGAVQVLTRQESDFQPGDLLSVAGDPVRRQGLFLLVDGVCRSLGRAAPLEPVAITDRLQAAHGELIAVEGRVRAIIRDHRRARLVLDIGGGPQTCTAIFEPPVKVADLVLPAIGSLARVSGPCTITGPGLAWGSDVTIAGTLGAAVRELAPAPWWSPARLQLAVWTLSGLLGLALPAAAGLRFQVRGQQRRIAAIEREAAVADERQRIAREIHDSLHQELAGVTLHLDNLKTALRTSPETAAGLAEETQAMLRHCQGEARNCVWDLRAGRGDDADLAAALRRWLGTRQPSGGVPRLELHADGEPPRLSAEQTFQMLRIAQETVNNALHHAQATRIAVSLRESEEGVELLIEDDGHGFEMHGPADHAAIHFGLAMLQERAARIHALIQMRSELHQGTRLRLLLPAREMGAGESSKLQVPNSK